MNYAEIVAASLDYADRASDTEVQNRMDNFMRIVESRINRNLMVQKMAIRSYVNTVDGREYYTLPDDFNGIRDVEIRDSLDSQSRTTLDYVSPEQLNNASTNSSLIRSKIYYTIVANQIQIIPIQPDGKILEFVYYRGVRNLTDSQTENWVSLYYPDAYIFGIVAEISSFTKDKEAFLIWDERFKQAVSEIEFSDSRTRWSGTALQTRIG